MGVIEGSRTGPSAQSRGGDRVAEIAEAVRTAIGEQRLLPGTKLPEDQIGSIFGASRTLVRAALQALAREGVVVLARNRGASIASPTVAEARALFDARRVIEPAIVVRAAAAASAEALDALEIMVEECRAALLGQERGRAIRLSGEFHLGISRAAGQPVLHEFLADLVARSSLVIALYGDTTHSECGDSDHRTLIRLLRDRDGTAAAAEMLQHLHHIEEDLDFTRPSQRPRSLVEILGVGGEPGRGEPALPLALEERPQSQLHPHSGAALPNPERDCSNQHRQGFPVPDRRFARPE